MKIYKILLLLITHISFSCFAMKDEHPKRPREESRTKFTAGEPALKKTKKDLSPKEQEAVNHNLLKAAHKGDLEAAEEALESGAQINYRIGRVNRGALYCAMESKNADIIRFLLENGAPVDQVDMDAVVGLVGCYMDPSSMLLAFINHGGIFDDEEADDTMLLTALGVFDELSMSDCNQPAAINSSESALWLLLRSHLATEDVSLPDYLDDRFYSSDGQELTLRDRLTPLLLALITGNQDEAKGLIEKLINRFYLPASQKRALNEALIFASAQGNVEILELLLNNFENKLTVNGLTEALRAAALRGQLITFKRLIISGLIVGPDLIEALESSLMTAAAQHHDPIVQYILKLDRQNNLNLDILPIGQRIDLLLSQPLYEERITRYRYLRNMLANHIRYRNAERLAPSRYEQRYPFDIIAVPARSESEEDQIRVIPPLPPELIWYLLRFITPPEKLLRP